MRYRKRPVEVEAMQFDGTAAGAGDVIDWVLDHPDVHATPSFYEPNETIHKWHAALSIPTREGTMWADPGDWIIIGIQNELYPCKPDIFEATYEPVEDVPELFPGTYDALGRLMIREETSA